MAEEETEETAEEAAPPPAPPVKAPSLLRYLPVVLVILLFQAGAAYFVISRYWLQPESEASGLEGERPRVIPESRVPEASLNLGEFVVNPRSEGSRVLVTADVTLAVAPDDAKSEIENDRKIDQVRDAVIYELTYATPGELNHREGRNQVKDRMMKRINDLLYEGQVVDIFFGRFIVQAMPGYKGESTP